jgi:hypothetical protein
MNSTSNTMIRVHAERLEKENEQLRWAEFRRASQPPAWLTILVGVSLVGCLHGGIWLMMSD